MENKKNESVAKPIRLIDSKKFNNNDNQMKTELKHINEVLNEKSGLSTPNSFGIGAIKHKKESGGLTRLKNTIKLKTKQFKDFSSSRKKSVSSKVSNFIFILFRISSQQNHIIYWVWLINL